MSSDAPQNIPAEASEGERRGRLKRRRTPFDYNENKESDVIAKGSSVKSSGTRKRSKRSDTRASREKKEHTRRQAAEVRRRRAERTKNRHAKPQDDAQERGRLVDNEDGKWYETDAILDRKVENGQVKYLVRWKDCPDSDNSWEVRRDLCDSLYPDADRLDQEALERASKFKEREKLLGLGESIQTEKVKGEELNEVDISEPDEGTKAPCEPIPSVPGDEELPWHWNDEEQVVYREVVRIDVNDSDAGDRVTEARENGTPLVLIGHKGWANFAKRWLVVGKEFLADTTIKEEPSNESDSSSLLDLSQPYTLDISRMIEDIGEEEVPVVKLDYNEENPICQEIKANTFLEHYRVDFSSGDVRSETAVDGSKLYLHQWQFPVSYTAGRKLCHQSQPLPNGVLGEDLLKFWYGDDLPQCKSDSPLQYLFMGARGTRSKMHRDNGGLAISIAPIVGEKECVLVHRSDGGDCLYHLEAKLDKIDLQTFPLMSQARVWRTTICPGEILLMPHGTYHQCRNLTPCLSYSRFHLDTVNIRAFLQSMYDEDAKELDHEKVIYNAAHELVEMVDAYVEKVQQHVKNPRNYEDSPLTTDIVGTVKDIRRLRHICREISRRKAKQADVKGPHVCQKVVRKPLKKSEGPSLRLPVAMPTTKESRLLDRDGESSYTADIWSSMAMDIDFCLHEFRNRRQKKMPRFHPRQAVDTSIDTTLVKEGTLPVASLRGSELEKAFLKLPRISGEESGLSLREDVDIFDNYNVTVHILGRVIKGTITRVEPLMAAAKLSYDEYPAVFDEYKPYDRLREARSGSVVKAEDVKPGLRVVSKSEGDAGEDFRAVVESITLGTMYKIHLKIGRKVTVDRWLMRTSIVKIDHPLVSSDSSMNTAKTEDGGGEVNEENANTSEVQVPKVHECSCDPDSDQLKQETGASNGKASALEVNIPVLAKESSSDGPLDHVKQDLDAVNGDVTHDSVVDTMVTVDPETSDETATDEPGIAKTTSIGPGADTMMDDQGSTTKMTTDESGIATASASGIMVQEIKECVAPRSRIIIGEPGSSDSSSDPGQHGDESPEGEDVNT